MWNIEVTPIHYLIDEDKEQYNTLVDNLEHIICCKHQYFSQSYSINQSRSWKNFKQLLQKTYLCHFDVLWGLKMSMLKIQMSAQLLISYSSLEAGTLWCKCIMPGSFYPSGSVGDSCKTTFFIFWAEHQFILTASSRWNGIFSEDDTKMISNKKLV